MDVAEDSDASLTKNFMRVSREQLLEDLVIKDKELGVCKTKQEKQAMPWWMRAIIIIASLVLAMIAVWGIVALVYANRLSKGVTAARLELAALNAEIARRLQLLDDTQRVVYELRNNLASSGGSSAAPALRLAMLQQALDNFAPPTRVVEEHASIRSGGGGGGTGNSSTIIGNENSAGSDTGTGIGVADTSDVQDAIDSREIGIAVPLQTARDTTLSRSQQEQGTRVML